MTKKQKNRLKIRSTSVFYHLKLRSIFYMGMDQPVEDTCTQEILQDGLHTKLEMEYVLELFMNQQMEK